jgi:hypothetical protein
VHDYAKWPDDPLPSVQIWAAPALSRTYTAATTSREKDLASEPNPSDQPTTLEGPAAPRVLAQLLHA